jgi:hypothetical protein
MICLVIPRRRVNIKGPNQGVSGSKNHFYDSIIKKFPRKIRGRAVGGGGGHPTTYGNVGFYAWWVDPDNH